MIHPLGNARDMHGTAEEAAGSRLSLAERASRAGLPARQESGNDAAAGDDAQTPEEAMAYLVQKWAANVMREQLMFGDEETTGVPALSIDI